MPAKSRSATNRFHYAMLGLAVTASIAAAIYNATTANTLRDSITMLRHSRDVRVTIDELVGENQLAETQALRYMVAQRADFLADYQGALPQLEVKLAELQALIAGNPEQAPLLAAMRNAIAESNAWNAGGIIVANAGPLQAVAARVREGTGARNSREIRAIALKMADTDALLLIKQRQSLDQTIVQATATTLLVNLLALIVGGIALLSLRRTARAFEAQRVAELEANQAARANDEKSTFLASMSHEIRTPMNAVFGFSQLLAKTKIEPQAREYVKAIQTSGRALLALINDILDLSKIEAGKLPLAMAATDIRELFDSTVAVFAETAGQKNLALRVQVAPDVPRTLVVDPHRLRQVLMNLVSNAIKYSDEGSIWLMVNTKASLGESAPLANYCDLHISVRDSGIGIPIERQRQLFEPFYRAVGDESERQGTGLGLAIVRRLLSLMNGEVSLVSAAGQGSTFNVELRRVEIATDVAHALDEDEREIDFARLKPSRILIVDDVAWNRDLLAAFLADGDHALAFAEDGEEALRVAEEHRPDVVLMDLRMPKLSGRAAAHRLRQTYGAESPAVIAVSASSMSREERDIGNDFDGYIRKPVAREVLFQALVEHIGLKDEPKAEGEGDFASALPPLASVNVSAEDRAAAVERLQRLARDELGGILARLRVVEIKKLAAEMDALGTSGGLPSINYFAQRLRGAVDRFDIMLMESLLHQLSDHVQASVTEHAGQ